MWNQVQEALNQSAGHLTGQVAVLLPGVIALFVALVVSILIAGILTFLVRRSLRGIDFDVRVARWGLTSLADWSPKKSPTLLVARVIAWLVVLMGLLVGVAAFDVTLTSRLVVRLFGYVPDVLAAALILFVGSILARILQRSVLIGAVNMNFQYAGLLSVGVKWLVLVLTFAMALQHLGIGGQIVYLAFGILFGGIVLALALAVALAVGLGSKDLVSRVLERQTSKAQEEKEPFRHL